MNIRVFLCDYKIRCEMICECCIFVAEMVCHGDFKESLRSIENDTFLLTLPKKQ